MVLDWLLDVVGIYFGSGLAGYWFYPLICLYLIGCVPGVIRYLSSWR